MGKELNDIYNSATCTFHLIMSKYLCISAHRVLRCSFSLHYFIKKKLKQQI